MVHIDSVGDFTKLVEQLGEAPIDAFAGATPYLKMLGQVVGGWVLVRQALAARALLDAGTSDSRLDAKITTASFYCEQLLPLADAQAPAVLAGASTLMALSADQF